MKQYSKYFLIIIIIIAAHFLIVKPISEILIKRKQTLVETSVLQEKVESVLKLVNIEGSYSEILDFKDYQYFNLPGFRKKALLKVNSTAAAGIDLEKVAFHFDESNKVLTITEVPQFEILYVHSQYSYFDLSEGIFNSFNESELNKIQDLADSIMQVKIIQSGLVEKARNEGEEIFVILQGMCESVGWKLKVASDQSIIEPYRELN